MGFPRSGGIYHTCSLHLCWHGCFNGEILCNLPSQTSNLGGVNDTALARTLFVSSNLWPAMMCPSPTAAGPWILKAGWGPLARLEFAIEAGIASIDRPSSIFSLVRCSRVAFARKHHQAYEDFLRRRLAQEEIDFQGGVERGGRGEALHPLAWRSSVVNGGGAGMTSRSRKSEKASASTAAAGGKTRTRTAKLEDAGAKLQNVVSTSGGGGDDEDEEEDRMKRKALEVAELEDALGSGRKSRLAGVKDRPPNLPQPLARLQGSPRRGDALLDLGQDEIVAYDSPPQRRLGA